MCPTDWPIRRWLSAPPSCAIFWPRQQVLKVYFPSISGQKSRQLKTPPWAIGKLDFWSVLRLRWGEVDLLDKIKGFSDHLLTAGNFYPDTITDIDHYVLNLDWPLWVIWVWVIVEIWNGQKHLKKNINTDSLCKCKKING